MEPQDLSTIPGHALNKQRLVRNNAQLFPTAACKPEHKHGQVKLTSRSVACCKLRLSFRLQQTPVPSQNKKPQMAGNTYASLRKLRKAFRARSPGFRKLGAHTSALNINLRRTQLKPRAPICLNPLRVFRATTKGSLGNFKVDARWV